jgi:hypothetical protein
MKRVATMLAVLLALAVTSVALAAGGGLSGAYKTVIKHPKQFKGTWVVTFTKGHYKVTANGKLLVKGKDTIKKNKISLTDTGGTGKCNGTGKYKFKLTAGKLKFTKISDTKSCAGRAAVLSHTFTKVS